MDRWQAAASITAFASIPFFPSFITLTNVAFPGISIVPLPLAVGLLCAMLVLAMLAAAGIASAPRYTPALLRPMLVWLGVCVLSLALGLNARDGSVFVVIFALVILWHAQIVRFYERPGVARAIWWSYLLSGVVASAGAIAMVVLRTPASLYSIANGRAVGTFVLPGELAGYLLFLIPISFALARTAETRALRAVAWIACGCGLIAMILTFSRTGWVGLAAGIGFLVAVRSRKGGLLRAGAIVAAALAIVLMLFNEHHNPSENYTRLSIWQAALGVIDRFPLTGVGPFGFSKIYPLVRMPDGDATAFHAHSLYLTFFAELGLAGLLAFGWTLVAFAREFFDRVRGASQETTLLPLAIAAGVAGSLVQGLIDTVSVVIFGLLLPMLALALATARARSVRL
ncbi:MAG TPA: O-antigen ligase family protein [Candidatus Aquilonibacter sp.]